MDMSKEPELARDYNVADESKIILFRNGIMVSQLEKCHTNAKPPIFTLHFQLFREF